MANHAYLPRSGLALVSDLTIACNTVFSMGLVSPSRAPRREQDRL